VILLVMEAPVEDNKLLRISYIKGSDGSINENLIPDIPVAVYALSEATRAKWQSKLKSAGSENEPFEVILLAEPKGEDSMQKRISVALSASSYKLMREKANFPKITTQKSIGGESATMTQVMETSPLEWAELSNLSITDGVSGREVPVDGILFCKSKGATEAEYLQARNLVVNEANKMLQLFDTEFRIPNFPPMENRPLV